MRLVKSLIRLFTRASAACLVALVVCIAMSKAAEAHAMAGFNLRVVRVVPTSSGFEVYYRVNLALVLGAKLGPQRADGTYEPAPFTWNEAMGELVVHHVDTQSISRDPEAFARLILDGHTLRADGRVLQPRFQALRIQPRGRVPPFDSSDQARVATTGPVYPEDGPSIDVMSAVADVAAFYPSAGPVGRLSLESTLHPGRMGGHEVVNLLAYDDPSVGAGGAGRQISGLLADPVPVFESWWWTMGDTIALGFRHILEGLDHVFFVLCLTIGASTLTQLATRVTAFTLGHSVTLALGALGLTPSAPWFVPAVELAIAASILYAGLTARQSERSGVVMIVLVVGIGLLHGFGFSFVLRDLVGDGGDHLIVRLAAFNIGVEFGQLLIVGLTWMTLKMIQARSQERHRQAIASVANGAAWVAIVWMIERTPVLTKALVG